MSERLSDSELDQLIDDAARSMTTSPAPSDMRARVQARLQDGRPRMRGAAWMIPASVAAVLVAAVAVWNARKPEAPDNRRVTTNIGSVSGTESSGAPPSLPAAQGVMAVAP